MGQKVNPNGLRIGIIKDWSSTWYANKKDFSSNLLEDYKIRKYLKNLLKAAGIAKLDIERKGSRRGRRQWPGITGSFACVPSCFWVWPRGRSC